MIDKTINKRAEEIILVAGKILQDRFMTDFQIFAKGDRDLVTSVDLEAERLVIAELEKSFPDHNILSEERGSIDHGSDWTWIIDPLDGTSNFSRRIPIFGISLALEYQGQVRLGLVYLPITHELFTAERGGGAFLNKQLLPPLVASPKPLAERFLTYCNGRSPANIKRLIDLYGKLRASVADFRKLGAATLEITHVARGLADGFIAPGLPAWDFKAAGLLVEEVGGEIIEKDDLLMILAPGVSKLLAGQL